MNRDAIVILGGYGKAGRHVAELVLESGTATQVVIAGRNHGKAQAVAQHLNQRHGKGRARAATADIEDTASLRRTFAEGRVVVVCVPYSGQAANVIGAAVDAGVDYVDLNGDDGKYRILRELDADLRRAGRVFISEAGIIPGCPAALAIAAGQELGNVDSVVINSLMRDPWIPPGGLYDLVSHLARTPRVFRNGRWRKSSVFSARRLAFGAPYQPALGIPVELAELEGVPERLGLRDLALYQAGLNPALDTLAVIWKMLGLSRSAAGVRLGVKTFAWANRFFTRPPLGGAIRVEARGHEGGIRIDASHPDLYTATAIPVVATVQQILAGEIVETGARFMGHAVDAGRFLEQLRALGMAIEVERMGKG